MRIAQKVAEPETAPVARTRSRFLRRAVLWAVTNVVPFAAALATLFFLVPVGMDGGTSGPWAFLARLRDTHPLLLLAVLFVGFAAVARHWTRPLRPAPSTIDHSARVRGLRFWIALAGVMLAALLARSAFIEIVRVVSASMVPTLGPRDRAIVNRLAYGFRLPWIGRRWGARWPRRGDVVVFSNDARPADDARRADEPGILVKRVLGLPGDVVSFEHGVASINGWSVPVCDAGPFLSTAGTVTVRGRLVVEFLEDQVYLTVREPADEGSFGPLRVPAGEVFVVGDARSVSRDSRAWNNGRGAGVAFDAILGRVTRLAVGSTRDGHLDPSQVLARLAPSVREHDVDLTQTNDNIAACLRQRRANTTPPSVLRDEAHPATAL